MTLDWRQFRNARPLHEAVDIQVGSRCRSVKCEPESIFPEGFLERLREAVVDGGNERAAIRELGGDAKLIGHALHVVEVIKGFESYKRRLTNLRGRVIAKRKETAARAKKRRRVKAF